MTLEQGFKKALKKKPQSVAEVMSLLDKEAVYKKWCNQSHSGLKEMDEEKRRLMFEQRFMEAAGNVYREKQ